MKNFTRKSKHVISTSVVLLSLIYVYYFLTQKSPLSRYWPNEPAGTITSSFDFIPSDTNMLYDVLTQLRTYPLAQFKKNHTLLRNFNWIDPTYSSGLRQPGYNLKDCIKKSVELQQELYENWNYYYLVSVNTKNYKQYRDTNTFGGAWVKFCNRHTNIETAAISFWAQVKPIDAGGNCQGKKAVVYSNDFNDSLYITGKEAPFLNKKIQSPAVPPSYLNCDYLAQSIYIDSLISNLKNPLRMLNENAEVFHHFNESDLKENPIVMRNYRSYPNTSITEYEAIRRLEKENLYKEFMQKPELKNCLYTIYSIDGQLTYRHDYKIIRQAQSKIRNQYYSTPDFYPRYPNNWKYWQGPWHGLDWIKICRNTETEFGDYLYSPFVAAGWDADEKKNIRPAQWMGLLKILSVSGAEFFYPGFFNTGKDLAKPENYIWQNAVPSYVQAISTWYEDVLLNGELQYAPSYFVESENKNFVTVVRKHRQNNKWVIATSIQPNPDNTSDYPESGIINIKIDNVNLTLETRRQGSVYIFEKENNICKIYQLDVWHEKSHPWYWSKDISLEAELYFPEFINGSQLKDLKPQEFNFIQLNSDCEFNFQYRKEKSQMPLKVKFLVKNKNKIPADFVIKISEHQNLIKKLDQTGWNWIEFEIKELPYHSGYGTLKVIANSNVLLDKIVISNK